jgi:anti-anti-sigma factor
VPLYACEQCGFTSAAFRPEAANAHRLENPDCDGVIRIIFRSEDRYRDPGYGPAATIPQEPPASAPESPASAPESPAPHEGPDRTFALRETLDPDEAVRLTLVGDLDLAAADMLRPRLAELKMGGRRTRLDLSQLAFIDSAGIQALLVALADARWDGWSLEVAPELSPIVQRAAEIVGIAEVLWPEDPDHARVSGEPDGQLR